MEKMEAAELGLVKYNTGRPCKRGHLSDRYTTTGACISCLHPNVQTGMKRVADVDAPQPRATNGSVQSQCAKLFLFTDEDGFSGMREYIISVGASEFPGTSETVFWPPKVIVRTVGKEIHVRVHVPVSRAAEVSTVCSLAWMQRAHKCSPPAVKPWVNTDPKKKEETWEDIAR